MINRENKIKIWGGSLLFACMAFSCGTAKSYEVAALRGSRELMDGRYDKKADKAMAEYVAHYKVNFDKEMRVQVATSDQSMAVGRPESLLTNFTADQMKRYGDEYTKGNCDLAIMNVNGHRSNLPKGTVTLENIYEVYSFDNSLVFLKVKGSDLTKVFEDYIKIGGAGISANVRLVGIGKRLESALVDGRKIYPDKIYTVVTLDYLADGNDGMEELRKAVSIEKTGVTLRDMMLDYVKSEAKAGRSLHSGLDGRIIISQ